MKRTLFFALTLLASVPACQAGEGFFSRLYTTDTTPAGHYEIEQLFRERDGRSYGHFNGTDSRTEVEYGITDNFQGSLYFNTGHVYARGAPDDDDPNGIPGFNRNRSFIQSVSAEFIYRVRSPYQDGYGLAFYVEPEFDFHDLHNGLRYNNTYELETRMILQKNFYDDRLILAYNLVLEAEKIRFKGEQDHAGELDWNNEFGATYRFASNWYAGMEVRNHNEYGHFNVHEHSVWWVGPALHYGGQGAWATLGFLQQVYGSPTSYNSDGQYLGGSHLFLRSHERREITVKVGIPF